MTNLAGTNVEMTHNRLSLVGFRRSHTIAYTPACTGCSACIPVRIRVDAFRLNRSFRRVLKANADLTGTLCEASASIEQFHLFSRYQHDRHADSDMALMGYFEYRSMIEDSPVRTYMAEFRDKEETLRAACLVDLLDDGISAVYSFFDTNLPESRSLGTRMVLWLIEECASKNLPYVYLGYWVEGSQKMAYKKRFHPLEAFLGPDGWVLLDP